MGVRAFRRRHGTVVRACGGGHGSTYLVGYLCLLSFSFVCRGVACNILVLVPPYPYLILFCLLRRRHTCCSLVLPMQASMWGWACYHYYSPWLVTHLCWSLTQLLLRSSLRGVAWHVTYLLLCLCVCAPSSPLLSLHTMLLVRGGGGHVVLAATCLSGHALHSLLFSNKHRKQIKQSSRTGHHSTTQQHSTTGHSTGEQGTKGEKGRRATPHRAERTGNAQPTPQDAHGTKHSGEQHQAATHHSKTHTALRDKTKHSTKGTGPQDDGQRPKTRHSARQHQTEKDETTQCTTT